MRELPLATCQQDFIVKAAKDNKRVDGRGPEDVRLIRISFGMERGSCQVLLGKTRVLANVTCEVGTPKPSRPAEGLLHVNLELSPMAASHHEAGRQSLSAVELTRLLERTLCESRCIDLESLCIIAGEQAWIVRIDVHILDDDGALIDCASIAAITALTHFRRPVFTVVDEKLVVFPPEEREPIPLSVYHMPVCCTFSFFDKGSVMLLDPTNIEQLASDGKIVIGMTIHREICTIHLSGNIVLPKEKILKCVSIASKNAAQVTNHIKKALEIDSKARLSGEVVSFAEMRYHDSILSYKKSEMSISVDEKTDLGISKTDMPSSDEESNDESTRETVIKKGPATATVGGGGPCTWDVSDDSEMEVVDVPQSKVKKPKPNPKPQKDIETINISEDSEEEEVVILNPENSEIKQEEKQQRGWYQSQW